MSTGRSTARDLADEAHVELGRLTTAWGWVTLARLPGAPGPTVRHPTSPQAAARATQTWVEDRVAALAAALAGIKTGTHPAPLRLGVTQARIRIAAEFVALTGRMHQATTPTAALTWHVTESVDRRRPCPAGCAGGILIPPADTHPPAPQACPSCMGAGTIPTGEPCLACLTTGRCRCDRDDLTVARAATLVERYLDQADVESAADALSTLADLADAALSAAGAGPDRRRLPGAECPVCGTRELVPEVSARNPRRWAIYCQGPDCVCAGPGCPCGIGTERRANRRHLWPAATWDGPHGLAQTLGVDLPGTHPDTTGARRAIATARLTRRTPDA